jgi:hypothetical protein
LQFIHLGKNYIYLLERFNTSSMGIYYFDYLHLYYYIYYFIVIYIIFIIYYLLYIILSQLSSPLYYQCGDLWGRVKTMKVKTNDKVVWNALELDTRSMRWLTTITIIDIDPGRRRSHLEAFPPYKRSQFSNITVKRTCREVLFAVEVNTFIRQSFLTQTNASKGGLWAKVED